MTKLKKYLLVFLVTAAVLSAAFVGGVQFQNKRTADRKPLITSNLIANEIAGISEYASLEYRYTNVGKFEDRVDFYGWKVPWTTKSFIITYDGAMKLGIKGSDITVKVDGDTILIALPPVQILSHEIHEDTLEVLDQTKNIFNQIQIQDYTGFAADQKAELEQKALEQGLFTEAARRAEGQLGAFLRGVLGEESGYQVVFAK